MSRLKSVALALEEVSHAATTSSSECSVQGKHGMFIG